jgi:hypothetical protein
MTMTMKTPMKTTMQRMDAGVVIREEGPGGRCLGLEADR